MRKALATTCLLAARFGAGGGDETRRSELYSALVAKLGPAKGLSVFDDRREENDPAAPTTLATRFPYAFYVDAKHIAYVSCGRLPLRAPGVDPGFPTVGTGDHDWRGFLAPGAHPHAIDPQGGVILNWNNKPAPGFAASDDTWTYGAGHRSLLLSRGIPATGRVSLLDAVRDMNRAATSDLRGVEVGAERLVAARPRRRRDDRRPGRRDPRRGMAEARGRGARAGARLLRER